MIDEMDVDLGQTTTATKDEATRVVMPSEADVPDSPVKPAKKRVFPMREVSIPVFNTGSMVFNPLTSFIGIAALWGTAIYAMIEEEEANQVRLLWRRACR